MSGQLLNTLDLNNLVIHDVQLDYYGKRVAAAAADGSVHIWDVTDNQQKLVGQIKPHDGPVWKVAWAHPKFGGLLATCSYDMKVAVLKEVSSQWYIAYVDSSHAASVNSVAFSPWEFGLNLACASSDGTISILTHTPSQQWRRVSNFAHGGGAQTLSWMPASYRDGSLASPMRLATGGCDNSVRIWKCESDVWMQETPPLPSAHGDWVRDVAWRPDSSCVLASGSWDGSVIIWSQEMDGQPWRQLTKLALPGKVESLSWSVTGSQLAVSCAEGETMIYKELPDGHFEELGTCNEAGFTDKLAPAAAACAPGFDAPAAPDPNSEAAAQKQAVLDAFGMS